MSYRATQTMRRYWGLLTKYYLSIPSVPSSFLTDNWDSIVKLEANKNQPLSVPGFKAKYKLRMKLIQPPESLL